MVEALKQAFMDCQLSCTSALSGIWVIEALARSNQVDISLLLALLKKTPEVSDDVGTNAREFVSLRILESLFFREAPNSVSSASQKIKLDPSCRCEDVLRRILGETSQSHPEPETWKWDLKPFIEHKRSNLGNYTLQQLKDAVLTASHPFLSSLKEQSGLPIGNQLEHVDRADDVNGKGITSGIEGGDKKCGYHLNRDLPKENLVTVTRKRRAIGENAGGNSCENQTRVKSVKKYKQGIIGSKEYEGRKLVSSGIDMQSAGTSKASTEHSQGERCSLGRKTHVGGMGLNEPPDDDYERTSLKGVAGPDDILPCEKQIPRCDILLNEKSEEQDQDHEIECPLKGHVRPDESLPHEKQAHHRGSEVPNENLDQEQGQDHDSVNAENYRKGLRGLVTTNEDMNKFEQNIPRNVPHICEAEKVVDYSSDSDRYHDERTSIDTKKKTFLSSQCTYSQDSSATTDWRAQNLCVRCNKAGKLLVCSSDSCPLVIHQSCLGSDASFDTSGKFYCPFCAYSRAISKYMEIKRKASLARKDLAKFICLGTQKESKKQCQLSSRIQQDHLEPDGGLLKINELSSRCDVTRVNNRHHRKRVECERGGPSELKTDFSPPFGVKAADLANRVPRTSDRVPRTSDNAELPNIVPHTLDNAEQERKTTRKVSKSPTVHGQHQMVVLPIHKSQGENDIRSKKGALCPQERDGTREDRCSPNKSADAEEISEEENDNSGVFKYIIRGRKLERECSYPAIPQSRRKRIPWTSAEEETLKKGMRLFCNPHDNIIPWKKVLEFGAGIFQQSRTAMDLKDKWRNMSKATPKS